MKNGPRVRVWRVGLLVALAAPGCFWMKADYTRRMGGRIANWGKEQELTRLLGEPYTDSEFMLYLRPAKPAVLVQKASQDFLAQFEGGNPPLEIIVIGSGGAESLSDFERSAIAKLNAAQKGPGDLAPSADNMTVTSMHGGSVTFELFSAQAQRTIGNPPSTAVYDWLVYFVEDTPQKLMVAFIIPDAQYADHTTAVQRCLESVGLGARYSAALSGGTVAATPKAP